MLRITIHDEKCLKVLQNETVAEEVLEPTEDVADAKQLGKKVEEEIGEINDT